MTALSRTEGGPEWDYQVTESFDRRARVSAPMSVADSSLCVPYTTSEKRRPQLLALDAAAGEEQWERELPSELPTTPVLADDVIFVGTEEGDLLALE